MGQDSQPVWGSSVTTRVVVRRKLRAAQLHTFLSRELGISPPPTGRSLFPPAPVDNII
jgi:hypothetical protein